jgi:hypothetical protein
VKRFEDWPRRLAAALEAARRQPFSWGEQDCALFAAGVVLAMTGADLAAAFRGRYATRAGAVALLGARGGLEAVATEALGAPLANARLARRGDVVMTGSEDGPALGVCGAGGLCWFAAPGGLTTRPLTAATMAWRV